MAYIESLCLTLGIWYSDCLQERQVLRCGHLQKKGKLEFTGLGLTRYAFQVTQNKTAETIPE
jgi:hypothetical protein